MRILIIGIFAVVFAASFFSAFSAFAATTHFKIQKATLSKLSSTAEGNINTISDGAITSNVIFHKIGDTAKYTITIKNTDTKDYIVKSITNDNTNTFISYEHDSYANTLVKAGKSFKFIVTAKYTNAVTDINKRIQATGVKFTINYIDGDSETIVINPSTGDNIATIVVTLICFIIGLTIINIFMFKNHKNARKIIIAIAVIITIIATATAQAIATSTDVLTINANYTLNDRLVVNWTDADDVIHTETINYNDTIDLPNQTAPEGHMFVGWFDSAEGGNKIDLTKPITHDIALFARIDRIGRLIHYDGNYEEGGSMEDDYRTISGRLKPNAFTVTGYHFAGWSLVPDGEKVYDDEEPMANIPDDEEPLTLYVIWEPNTYTFIFHANSEHATSSMEPFVGTYDGYRSYLPANKFVLEDYHFIGWKIDNKGELIHDGASVNRFDAENGEIINLYAQWEENPIGIDYYANSDEVTGVTLRHERIGTTSLRTPNYHRDGYGFAGWNSKPDGSGTMYGTNEYVTIPSTGLKLYAIWIKAEEGITMQTFNDAAEPYASYPNGKVIALKDNRDNQVYTIAKLADGKWWMTENLRLVPKDIQLTADKTNNPAPALAATSITTTMCTENTMECINKIAYNSGNLNTSPNGSFAYGNGVYYNVFAATAGHAAVDTDNLVTEQVAGDICPKGWHLPVSGMSGDFRALDISLGGTGRDNAGIFEHDRKYFKYPINITLSGWIEGIGFRNIVSDGVYLENGTDGLKHTITTFNDASITFDEAAEKYLAFPVRCIAN